MKNILITGGAGFVGFHLAKKLSKDNKVTIIDNFKRPNKDKDFLDLISSDNVEHINLDLSDVKAFDSLPTNVFDIVYHFAALNGTSNFYNYPANVLKIGTFSTINLLDWVAKHTERPEVIYTSSSEAYAGTATLLGETFPIPTPEDVPLAIDDVTNVRWSYGASKLIGEIAFYSYRKSHNIDKFKIIRLHNIYGPRMGNEHVISQFVQRHLDGVRPFEIFGGSNTRSFCYIEDVLDALDAVVYNGVNGEIYHIGNDDEEVSIEQLAKMIFDINDEEYNFHIHEAPAGSVNRRCPNINKIKKLGHSKSVPLLEGLKRTYRWYKDERS